MVNSVSGGVELLHAPRGDSKISSGQFLYATSLVDTPKRFEYWHHAICTHFIPAESWKPKDNGFVGELKGHSLGGLLIGQYDASEHCWHRTPNNIRYSPGDDLVAYFVEDGCVRLEQNGNNITLNSGEIALYDAATPFIQEVSAKSLLLMRMPRGALMARTNRAERIVGMKIGNHNGMATVLGGLMKASLCLPNGSDSSSLGRLATAFLETLSVAIHLQAGDDLSPSHADSLYIKTMAYLQANIEDETLSMETISSAMHVSERTLFRAFAKHQSTPMQQLWLARLKRSYDLLETGQVKRVTQAAYQSGFSDVSHFCRVFRKEFGVTPGKVVARI